MSHSKEFGILSFKPSLAKLISDNFWLATICIIFIWTGLAVIYFIWKYLEFRYRKYILTNQRLIIRQGVIFKNLHQLELYRVFDYQINRGLLYQSIDLVRGLFRCKPLLLADILLISSDHSHPHLWLTTIPNALGIYEQIRDAVNNDKNDKSVIRRDH